MSSPKVSFVIPSFNSAAWLAHAVESAQKQDYPRVEIVVVDDGSTDSTQGVMKFICDKDARINYIRLPKNCGRSHARNIGNRAATGEYIFVLDADDIAYPDRAKLSVAKLKSADFVHGSCDYIDAIGSMLGTHQADTFSMDRAVKDKVNRIVHSTCAYSRQLAVSMPYCESDAARLGLDDWQFQLEVAASGSKIDFIPAVIGAYRDIGTGVSKTRDPQEVDSYKTRFLETMKHGV